MYADETALQAIKSAITSLDISKLSNAQACIGLATAMLMALPTAGATSEVALINKNLSPSPPSPLETKNIGLVLFEVLDKKRDKCLAEALSGYSGVSGLVLRPKTEVECINEWTAAMRKASRAVTDAENALLDARESRLAIQERANAVSGKKENLNREKLRKNTVNTTRRVVVRASAITEGLGLEAQRVLMGLTRAGSELAGEAAEGIVSGVTSGLLTGVTKGFIKSVNVFASEYNLSFKFAFGFIMTVISLFVLGIMKTFGIRITVGGIYNGILKIIQFIYVSGGHIITSLYRAVAYLMEMGRRNRREVVESLSPSGRPVADEIIQEANFGGIISRRR